MQMKKKERSLLLIFLVGILLAGSVYLYGGKPGMQTVKASDTGNAQLEQQAKETVAENSKQVKVHVKGAVNQPGVYKLPSDSRVIDAIQAAGGAKSDAKVQQLNLASVVADGAEVVVPGDDATNGNAAAAATQDDGKVNVNTASAEDLDKLPGIGSIRAKAIVDYRTEHGQFYSIDDLRNVPGLGAKLLDAIRDHVKVE
jgi:competence protein ComEA